MYKKKQTFKKGIIELVLQWLSPRAKPPSIPEELQKALDRCSSVPEVMTLLFSMKGMNEAAFKAFDKRIEELQDAA